MDFSRNAQIYDGENDYDDIEDDAQSMPYYDEDETIEVNDDSYWDFYYDPDNLDNSFSD
jgi:hypothetical protein